MSFRIYLDIKINTGGINIYNNTYLLNPRKYNFEPYTSSIVVIGINTEFSNSYTVTDSTNNYIELSLPSYQIVNNSNTEYADFIRHNLIQDRRANLIQFKAAIENLKADYILIYINNLDGNTVESTLLEYLKSLGSAKLENKNNGTWAMLLRPIERKRFSNKIYTVIREKYSLTDEVELYYLTQSDISCIDKDRWNELFDVDFSDVDIANYYQALLDTVDDLIYTDESPIVQILSRLHHHLTHPRDDNNDGAITADNLELPYYDLYPDQLAIDISLLVATTKELHRELYDSGITGFTTLVDAVNRSTLSLLTYLHLDMLNKILELRNKYVTVRDEITSKIL